MPMSFSGCLFARLSRAATVLATALVLHVAAAPAAQAQLTAFRQAVAESAARDDDLAAFYRSTGFEGVWSGSDSAAQARRNALLTALTEAPAHGLPAARYDVPGLVARLHAADTPAEQGAMEVELSRALLRYARDVQSGILVPREVVNAIRREVPYTPRLELLQGFMAAEVPAAFLRSLPPAQPEYARLMREKLRLESLIPTGGWGPTVPGGRIDPGDSGDAVVALRNRLIAMGYLDRSVSRTYDAAMQAAVQMFQQAHGLEPDGVAGGETLSQINVPLERRLQSVLVAMERERWMNFDRGDRHVWVNLVDFTAAVVDFDRVTFQTKSVIGSNTADRQTPEFSDEMDHLVINPSWWVPRSIIVGEYGGRVPGGFQAVDSRGRPASVSNVLVNGNVRYSVRQLPGPGNALGQVKFMFPNPYNIYLHDTPSQSLFARTVRTFSHGCIRLDDPQDFAYVLLAAQTDDPVEFFQSRLRTRQETRVDLETPIPVHLVYRTAYTNVLGELQFRNDVYGRDARIWDALVREGVTIGGVQG